MSTEVPLTAKQLHKGTGDVLRDLEYAERFVDGDGVAGALGKQLDFINRALRVAHGEIRQLRQQRATKPSSRSAAHAEEELDAAWTAIERGWDIEPRAYFEKEAPTNGFRYPLVQAIHHMWKRETKAEMWQPIETCDPTLEFILGSWVTHTDDIDVREVGELSCEGSNVWWNINGVRQYPTHWMPLPAPPRAFSRGE